MQAVCWYGFSIPFVRGSKSYATPPYAANARTDALHARSAVSPDETRLGRRIFRCGLMVSGLLLSGMCFFNL